MKEAVAHYILPDGVDAVVLPPLEHLPHHGRGLPRIVSVPPESIVNERKILGFGFHAPAYMYSGKSLVRRHVRIHSAKRFRRRWMIPVHSLLPHNTTVVQQSNLRRTIPQETEHTSRPNDLRKRGHSPKVFLQLGLHLSEQAVLKLAPSSRRSLPLWLRKELLPRRAAAAAAVLAAAISCYCWRKRPWNKSLRCFRWHGGSRSLGAAAVVIVAVAAAGAATAELGRGHRHAQVLADAACAHLGGSNSG